MSDAVTLAFLGIHPDRLRHLRDTWGGSRAVVRAIIRGRIEGLTANDLVPSATQRVLLDRCGAHVVERGGAGYPVVLETIIDPPEVLFVRGTLPPTPGVAIVGTRRCTAYGRGLARSFGGAIARAGWTMVSGLARGIDGEAHRGSLDADGPGIGVLGCGIDTVYPREHTGLHRALAATGALVTEYPPGTPPHGWRFPVRNRIISGLARAVVVVEATPSGGALVTAARAIDQGREVFAVPGDVDRESSVGCNLLIRDGAIPVLGPDDLVEGLSLLLGSPSRRPEGSALPAGGIERDELAERLGLDGAGIQAWIGRQELAGAIRVEGTRIHPVG